MRRIIAVMLVMAAAGASAGCYVTQDLRGQWWACETYQAASGVATACTPIQPPW